MVHALRDRTACLMGNHGAVAVGPDLVTAQDKSAYLEWLCDVYLRASSAGTPRLLSAAEIAAVARENGGIRPAAARCRGTAGRLRGVSRRCRGWREGWRSR